MLKNSRNNSALCLLMLLALGGGCTAHSGTPEGGTAISGPTHPVTQTEAVPAALKQALAKAEKLDGDGIMAAYPAPQAADLTYDPSQAAGLSLIQASHLALNDDELAKLQTNGFTITDRVTFPSFAYGYKSIYADDLPLYVSADSILEAVHRTFESLLKQTEQVALMSDLTKLLNGMRQRLPSAFADDSLTKDADLYLAVAASLLKGSVVAPVAGANEQEIADFVDLATKATRHQIVDLFGVKRDEDFSQFEPRGHYVDSVELQQYFRTMMWLGRVDLRLIETLGDGSQVFRRRQFDAAVALRQLMGDTEYALWQQVDETIGAFAGEHDSMTPADMDGLMQALKVSTLTESQALSDDAIIDEIAKGGWGAQRIASRIIIKSDPTDKPLPLDRSFLLFGQRYTVDSHTFVNVTFDRVEGRLMPKPLDAAFAALGNNAALPLLADEFDNPSYVAGLAKTRTLVDAHEAGYWDGSLYTRWLGALRSLSPNADEPLSALPQTTAWQSRVLSAQLGSWAELRHDTILYVKQSYTTGILCEFPDAYVDPYPEFYARLGALADAVVTVTDTLPAAAADVRSQAEHWAVLFKAVTANLQTMAENQLSGTPHSQELLDFINDAVKWDEELICGGVTYSNLAGWYLRLYLDEYAGLEYDPTVADVHTQPTDGGGNDVGRILHVGTGMPRLMVVTAETCQGPRAYAGLAFSYGELITEDWERLNDDEWQTKIARDPFPDPAWMSDALSK